MWRLKKRFEIVRNPRQHGLYINPVNYLKAIMTGNSEDPWRLDKRWGLFMNPRIHGNCFNPWQFLKVDSFNRTNVCCCFFERTMQFDWPTSQEFHSKKGTWNHPFMQHLRETMGAEDEVPHCGFCLDRYRKDLPMRTSKKIASIESQKIYQDKFDEAIPFIYSGRIESLGADLQNWSFPLKRKQGYIWKPFKNPRQLYRRSIRRHGFQDLGKVVQLGCCNGAFTPFLAEPANELTVIDWRQKQLLNVCELLDELDLNHTTTECIADLGELPFADGSIDGVWLDGDRWFTRYSRKNLFQEIRRILRPGGRLRIVRAAGAGTIIRDIVLSENRDKIEIMLKRLRENGAYDGENSFLTIEGLSPVLKAVSFVPNQEYPPLARPIGNKFREQPLLGYDHLKIAEQLSSHNFRERIRNNPELMDGLEESISFSAWAV